MNQVKLVQIGAEKTSKKKITRGTPLPPPNHTYHQVRKLIHLGCVVVFIALPFFNLMRFDISRQRFYFFGYELLISEFGIIFFSLMFLMFLIAGASILYGRVYCGYLCPQMIFSEASVSLENQIKRLINKHLDRCSSQKKTLINKVIFYSLLIVTSVFLAFVFISYFVAPRDLIHSVFSFDITTIAGISGAVTTAIVFLDFAFVRQRFCTTVCPYGYLQGVLGDKNTLVVNYRDEKQECIECKKCVRVCPMGIDIRKSPYQFECTHCGECIDACTDVLGKLGYPTLIDYTWGEKGLTINKELPWYKKLGFLDAKRLVIVLVLLFYGTGLFLALSMRKPILVKLSPNRTTLYKLDDKGLVYNKFRLVITNRGKEDALLNLSTTNLPTSQVLLQPVTIKVGSTIEREFEISVTPKDLPAGVNHFQILSQVVPYNQTDKFELTFITPTDKAKK